jgi:hypothetical protein
MVLTQKVVIKTMKKIKPETAPDEKKLILGTDASDIYDGPTKYPSKKHLSISVVIS